MTSVVASVEPPVRAGRKAGSFGVISFCARRTAYGLVTLAILSVLVFAATQALPGDPARQVLGPTASQVQVDALSHQLGLDKSIVTQYGSWVSGLVQGDLGTSITSGQPVADVLGARLWNSLFLLLLAAGIAVPLAGAIGVASALRRGRGFDAVASVVSLTLAALPEFVVALLLVVLLATGALHVAKPVSLLDPTIPIYRQIDLIVLPVVTLVMVVVPYMIRVIRTSMIEIMDSDYIESARLNGIPPRKLVWSYALPNALAPTAQVVALVLAYLAGGIVVVETVFNFPGVGSALVTAVRYRDIPVVQVLALATAAVYVICNLAADLVVMLVTPRLRTGG
jgi:peptide/nickel transport system permease protein